MSRVAVELYDVDRRRRQISPFAITFIEQYQRFIGRCNGVSYFVDNSTFRPLDPLEYGEFKFNVSGFCFYML